MRHFLVILIVGILSFVTGWWVAGMRQHVKKTVIDGQEVITLKKVDSLKDNSKVTSSSKKLKKKRIQDYMSDEQFIHWTPNHPDTTGYLCELTLHRLTALYWFHGQCGYDYFTYATSDSTVDVVWSYRSDCILNMDFLEKSNGIKKYPKCRDTFATITLIDDTTLRVKYYFPQWTKRVNEIAKDSLFPTYYYMMREN